MNRKAISILSIGGMNGKSNTCLHRHWALEKVAHHIDVVNSTIKYNLCTRIANRLYLYGLPIRLPDFNVVNKKIIEKINACAYDIVWIDKGIIVFPETLREIKKKSPQTKIVSYSPDNMALRHNQSQQYVECIPLYDYIITNKSYIIEDMKRLNVKEALEISNFFIVKSRTLTRSMLRFLDWKITMRMMKTKNETMKMKLKEAIKKIRMLRHFLKNGHGFIW